MALDQPSISGLSFVESMEESHFVADSIKSFNSISTSGLLIFDNRSDSELSRMNDTLESSVCNIDSSKAVEKSAPSPIDEVRAQEKKCADDFRQFVVKNKMQINLVQGILNIFQPVCPNLPLSYSTFVDVKELEPFKVRDFDEKSKFAYLGIRRQLKSIINPDLHPDQTEFDVRINCDGLPLFRGSKNEFWPILGHILFDPPIYKPFVIAIYYGKGKPKDINSYLAEFIDEFNCMKNKGIYMGDKNFKFKSVIFVCDIPARVYLKQIKGHTGFSSCERCTIPGFSLKHRTIFPFLFYEKRTDTSFRSQKDPQHHKGVTPLCKLQGVDLVLDFVLDVMHLVYLGVMKKLLTHYWQPGCPTKLSKDNFDRFSAIMMNLSAQIPKEFQRATRSLEDLSLWKATEFRLFLLYVGPFVMKGILPDQLYRHFMLLHVSLRILNSKKLFLQEANLAQFYLERFFLTAQHIYGFSCLGMNMHLLSSLADEVRRFRRPLEELSAFAFENLLGGIKRRLRSGFKPLEQVCRGILEEELIDRVHAKFPKNFEILSFQRYKDDFFAVKELKFRQFVITPKPPNNVVLLKDGTYVVIENIFTTSENFEHLENIKVRGKMLEIDGPAFMYPANSSLLDIYRVKMTEIHQEFTFAEIDSKVILLNIFEKASEKQDYKNLYVVPFLHNGES